MIMITEDLMENLQEVQDVVNGGFFVLEPCALEYIKMIKQYLKMIFYLNPSRKKLSAFKHEAFGKS